MNTFTVSFFGHRHLSNPIATERALEKIIRELLHRPEYVEFIVGRDGDFDLLAASIIKRYQRAINEDNSALIWVLPYATADFRDNEEAYQSYYDEIEICETSAGKHYKAAFQTRNRSIVDRSDLVIFCIERTQGGAYQTMRYAQKQGKRYINITDIEDMSDPFHL